MEIKIPDHYEKYKFYSKEDACIEICHNTEYIYDEAVEFVKSLGFKVTGGDMWYDEMFKDWRGYVNVYLEFTE